MIIAKEAVTLIHTDTNIHGLPETELYKTLSDDEKTRADGYRVTGDREHFIARRGILRNLLGASLGIEPSELHFSSTPVGKPFIASPENSGIWFNLSYSGNQIVFAFSGHPETGIAIEKIRTVEGIEELARNHFCAEEYAVIMNLPSWEKHGAFIRIWNLKEALIKASGWPCEQGLVAFDVATYYRMNRFRMPFGDNYTFTCITPVFDYICGYATALAIRLDRNEPLNLRRFSLQGGEYIEL
ncbi:MAG: 4'-phosphopantetheinyl transferase superfamily protein [Chlorobi bacterium]|nr:4'-phosphopantetheinyl transferase superfamily protein [Chlorobiota bacterium]